MSPEAKSQTQLVRDFLSTKAASTEIPRPKVVSKQLGIKPTTLGVIYARLRKEGLDIPYVLPSHTTERRQKISEARRGHKVLISEIKERSTVGLAIRPLVLRGLTNIEISEITKYSDEQVFRATRRGRIILPDDYYNQESVKNRLFRSRRHGAKTLHNKFTQDDRNSLEMAQKFYTVGMIVEEPVFWNFVKEIATRHNKTWFEYSPKGLVMEIFSAAVFQEMRGKKNLKDLIDGLGRRIDIRWYDSEEMNVDKGLIRRSLAEKFPNLAKESESKRI